MATETMRAWRFAQTTGGIEKHMKLEDAAPRPPLDLATQQSKDVLVEVYSAALNPADYKIAEIPFVGKLATKMPATPCIDFAGKVYKTGSAVDTLGEGEMVFGRLNPPIQFGTLGQYVKADIKGTVPLPEGVDVDSAAAVGTAGLTAYENLKPNVKSGDKIFINGGSGGTGTYGIQIAKAMGCHVTTSCSTGNVELCKNLGADEVIDYKTQDVTETLKSKGQVFDFIFDTVGGSPANLYHECHHFLRPSGKFNQVGGEMKDGMSLLSRALVPSFLGGGQRKYAFTSVSNNPDSLQQLGKWLKEGKITTVIDTTYKFEDAVQAFEKLKTGRTKGKLVVHVKEH